MTLFNSFIVGALLTSAAWLAFWPDETSRSPEAASVKTRIKLHRTISKIDLELLSDESASHREKVAVLQNLESASTAAIKAQLEEWHQVSSTYRQPFLRERSRILLSEWARRDPERAIQWSWNRFKKLARWHHAWSEIGSEWASSDPEGFLQFYRKCYRKNQISSADIEKSTTPLIQARHPQDYDEWLAKGSLSAAFTFLREKDTFIWERDQETRRSDFRLIDTLQTESDFGEALRAWDGYEPDFKKKPSQLPFADRLALTITDRWRREFPDHFAKSRYKDWPVLKKESPKPAANPTARELEAQRDRRVLNEFLRSR